MTVNACGFNSFDWSDPEHRKACLACKGAWERVQRQQRRRRWSISAWIAKLLGFS